MVSPSRAGLPSGAVYPCSNPMSTVVLAYGVHADVRRRRTTRQLSKAADCRSSISLTARARVTGWSVGVVVIGTAVLALAQPRVRDTVFRSTVCVLHVLSVRSRLVRTGERGEWCVSNSSLRVLAHTIGIGCTYAGLKKTRPARRGRGIRGGAQQTASSAVPCSVVYRRALCCQMARMHVQYPVLV